MPVRRYMPVQSANYHDLVDRLTEEWRQTNSNAVEPVILEEPDSRGVVRHIYVIWSDWARFPDEDRGEIIMEAAQRVKQPDDLLQITIALGLTPEQADHFPLKWR